jgi:2-iminobutanoate/2-iminopropanoate deaminase
MPLVLCAGVVWLSRERRSSGEGTSRHLEARLARGTPGRSDEQRSDSTSEIEGLSTNNPSDPRARRPVATSKAPAAIGPYSQAVRSGDLLFLSGQIGLDPATGQLVSGGIEAEARQALRNLCAVLEAEGASFDDVVKTTIFLTNLEDFAAVNRLYGEHVGAVAPARATVEVRALPKGAVFEIDAVAHLRA